MKVIILLFFVLLLGYQIYMNLKEEEGVEVLPTPSDRVSAPVKIDLPPDLPTPTATAEGINEAPTALESPAEYRDMTVAPAVQDVASGQTPGENPPIPDPGSFLDVGSKGMAPPSDQGSLLPPGQDKGS